MMKNILILMLMITFSCKKTNVINEIKSSDHTAFDWKNATIYFMLTDRFNNANTQNDFVAPSDAPPAKLRGFMGGDVAGITAKINEGYFDSLGVQAIWMTPLVENIKGSVDEGTGISYGFHGYWTRDWTAIDSRIGTEEEVKAMVNAAHGHHIKVIFDVVANHTGPVTSVDSKWPDDWVKTGPRCVYKDYASTVNCTLVDNLPDIRTESDVEVTLPDFLIEKWKKEGRYEQEVNELDEFFKRTNYPRKPYFYIIKWLTDMITDYGIDGYRIDTAKHTEEEVWSTLHKEALLSFEKYKKSHPEEKRSDDKFYMVGEVYNYFIGGGRLYDFGDKKVDYFNNGFDALINFDFKGDANKSYEELFVKYDSLLNGPLKDRTVLNYISSHDDGGPFDLDRKRSLESGTKLLLTPGQAQIYYGDETARTLTADADGDAKLRSFMNWNETSSPEKMNVLTHWRKLGAFRKNHVSIGAGRHKKISEAPYVFSRTLEGKDKVVISLDYNEKLKHIFVGGIFKDGMELRDAYSGMSGTTVKGYIDLTTEYNIVLLEPK